jgi:uncharacterized protein YgiM (DUF1202 family)
MKAILLCALGIVLLTACSNQALVPATATATTMPTETMTPTQTQLPTPTYTFTPVVTPNGLKGCVIPGQLNVRGGPGPQYDILGVLPYNTCVLAIARSDDYDWVYELSDTYSGWVSINYLTGTWQGSDLPLFTKLTQTPETGAQNPVPSETTQP